jgi:hypothetical protein
MAWLEKHPTSGRFKICFRWSGRKRKKTVKTTDRADVETALARFEENLHLLERGRLELPPGAEIGTFLLSDGKLNGRPIATSPLRNLTLGDLRDAYVATHSNGATQQTRHVLTLGEGHQSVLVRLSEHPLKGLSGA